MKIIAKILSTILHPLLMPVYGIILVILFSFMRFFPIRMNLYLFGLVAVFTLFVPLLAIVVLYSTGIISSINLRERKDRKWPFLIAVISYIICGVLFYRFEVPLWILGFITGGVISLLIDFIITFWWKISAHMTGIGGFTACSVFLTQTFEMFPLYGVMLVVLAAGLLGSSRILLNRHTLGQVLAGTVNGFASIYIAMLFI